MAISTKHPQYTSKAQKWETCNDTYDGEDQIKDRGVKHLPATSGQIADGQGLGQTSPGELAYQAYKLRAVFPDLMAEAVEAAIGTMHRKPASIELPSSMEPLRLSATPLGESLQMVLRKINVRQLVAGRVGLLGDVQETDGQPTPVLVLYGEGAVINWVQGGGKMAPTDVVLAVADESGYVVGADLQWSHKAKFKVFALMDAEGKASLTGGTYGFADAEPSDEPSTLEFTAVTVRGNTLQELPFTFINSKDLAPTPDNPPLYGLAKLALAIYRGDADHRQHLFMQSQDTLVLIGNMMATAVDGSDGDEAPIRTGAGASINVPQGGDAKYIGVSGNGLSEQRQNLENDYKRATQKAGQLLDSAGQAKESGEALKIRSAAQTATLVQIAQAGAAGLETVLKAMAPWFGANPEDIVVTPNLEFTDANFNGMALVQMQQAKTLGAPLSSKSIHGWLADQGMTKLTYDEEVNTIDSEVPGI
jgi:hypothetical protein